MRSLARLLLGTTAALAIAGPAAAAVLTASTILRDFNDVIYDNASTGADIEGASVIGGNFSGATIYTNPVVGQPAGFGALTVFGTLSGNLNVDNGGSVYASQTSGATVNFNGGGHFLAAPGATITDFSTPLNALSQSLAELAATGTLPATGNNEVITAHPGANHVAVFDLTAAALAAIPSFSINLNGATAVVFNVSGSSANFNANIAGCCAAAKNIIWNFYNATGTVAINTQIEGTVLATGATVRNANQIDGDLVAKNWVGNGELHEYPPHSPVPEPATLALLAVAAAALAAVRGRPAAAPPTRG